MSGAPADDPAALLEEGRRLLESGMSADAIAVLGRAFAARPDDSETARWLAEAQLVADAADDARQTLDAALSLTPGRSELIVLQSESAL